MDNKLIGIASDHAGYPLKKQLADYLIEQGYKLKDFGTNSEERVDYPDFGHALASAIDSGELERGIVVCGSGNGINMTANKHPKVRSALCWINEISVMARRHNDANVCALPGRYIDFDLAKQIVDSFLNTGFDGDRHLQRINKIPIK